VTLESIQLATPFISFNHNGPKVLIINGLYRYIVPSFNIDQFFKIVIKIVNYKLLSEDILTDDTFNSSIKFSPRIIALKY